MILWVFLLMDLGCTLYLSTNLSGLYIFHLCNVSEGVWKYVNRCIMEM